MKIILFFALSLFIACSNSSVSQEAQTSTPPPPENLVAMLDTILRTEQEPIRLRDSFLNIYGDESKEFMAQQEIYEQNHAINEKKISAILDNSGWPAKEIIGERGNRTICNVIQHAENDIRIKYLPMMKQAVLDKQLNPQLLVRAEDRIATERGDLQIYGGQMKFYPETKTFNVWPVLDPVNIDQRRAAIGLDPIADHLKNRFDFEWDLEEQIKRTEEFKKEMNKK
jgi:hypothetical protein